MNETDFNVLQYVATLETNIQILVNSSVVVGVTDVAAGPVLTAVDVTSVAIFPSRQTNSVNLYVSTLAGSNTIAIFGSALGATVNSASIFVSGEQVRRAGCSIADLSRDLACHLFG